MNRKQLERVVLTDALSYIKEQTGYDFERRTFLHWIEQGFVKLNGNEFNLIADKIGERYYINRANLDNLIVFLNWSKEQYNTNEG